MRVFSLPSWIGKRPALQCDVRSPLTRSTTACVTTGTKNYDIFDLPRTVLDLDAEDHPNVRKYDKEMEEADAVKWRKSEKHIDVLHRKLMRQDSRLRKAVLRKKATTSRMTRWNITSHDIWRAALSPMLATGPKTEYEEDDQFTKQLLHSNGVSLSSASDPLKSVQWMTALYFRRRELPPMATETLAADIRQSRTMDQLRRHLHVVLCRKQGFECVAGVLKEVHDKLVQLHGSFFSVEEDQKRPDETATTDVLVLLLNLVHSLARHNLGIGSDLTHMGLAAAATQINVPAMHVFLRSGIHFGYLPSSGEEKGSKAKPLVEVMRILANQMSSRRTTTSRVDLLTLLTGRSLIQALPHAMGSRRSSFRAALGTRWTDDERFAYYLLLAKLGAVHTMWQELYRFESQVDRGLARPSSRLQLAVEESAYRYHAIAEDFRGSLDVLWKVKPSPINTHHDLRMLQVFEAWERPSGAFGFLQHETSNHENEDRYAHRQTLKTSHSVPPRYLVVGHDREMGHTEKYPVQEIFAYLTAPEAVAKLQELAIQRSQNLARRFGNTKA